MQRTSYLKQIATGSAMVIFAVFTIIISIVLCAGTLTNRNSGQLSKDDMLTFKMEISTEKPDEYSLGWLVGSYDYTDCTGTKISVSFQPADLTNRQPTCVREIEVPRNFNRFLCSINVPSFDELDKEKQEGIIYGKVYVDEKLIVDFTSHKFWIITITYNDETKQYDVLTSDGVEHEIFRTNI